MTVRITKSLAGFDLDPALQTFLDGPGGRALRETPGAWLCGGALRRIFSGEPYYLEEYDIATDFDIFFETYNTYLNYKKCLLDYGCRLGVVFDTVTELFTPDGQKIQLITREFYKRPWSHLDIFDMTVCQLWSEGDHLGYYQQAIDDIDARILRPVYVDNVHSVIKHVMKYGMYGYEPSTLMTEAIIKAAQNSNKNKIRKNYY